ncbi:MAG: hypothetical protein ABI823_16450 [Bryobacteraceae bacterium]
MNETTSQRRPGRSLAALGASFLAVVVLSMGTDAIMYSSGAFPPLGQPMPDALFLVALAYRTLYGVAGGYIAARLAPYRPMQQALASGAVGLAISLVGVVMTWDKGPEMGPKWYSLALMATTIPCAWAGAKLAEAHKPGPQSAAPGV